MIDKLLKQKINYWIDLAEYDLETAKTMLKGKRYLYVGFMCHQTIEKSLKAYFVFSKAKIPPYTHSLARISEQSEMMNLLTESQKEFLDILEPLNIEARYSTYKENLLKTLTNERCKEIVQKTEELFLWIKSKL